LVKEEGFLEGGERCCYERWSREEDAGLGFVFIGSSCDRRYGDVLKSRVWRFIFGFEGRGSY